VVSPRCSFELQLGQQAAARLVSLVNAGPFEIVPTSRDQDGAGRKLRLLMRDGQSLGDVLVSENLADPVAQARRSWC
jgi:hypothetical protein